LVRSKRYILVIAGLDPAIQDCRRRFGMVQPGWWSTDAVALDRRVKPGDDTWVARFNSIVV
jgi:hypothetical protein